MSGELTVANAGAVAIRAEGGALGELLKPLTREIHLFDSYVAGTTHLSDPTVLDEVAPGDRLTLQREQNRFDDNAIVLLTQTGKKLGYVPEADNLIFARLMDAGKLLGAQIADITPRGKFRQIRIGIYLVDF